MARKLRVVKTVREELGWGESCCPLPAGTTARGASGGDWPVEEFDLDRATSCSVRVSYGGRGEWVYNEHWAPGEVKRLRALVTQSEPDVPTYEVIEYRISDEYELTKRVDQKHYEVGCQRITRKRMTALCKAILADEGELP